MLLYFFVEVIRINKIKTKDVIKGTIKSLDKSAIVVERTKDILVNVKEKSENAYNNDSNVNEYASSKVEFTSNRAIDETIAKFNIKGKESVLETKENYKKAKTKIKTIKSKLTEKRKLPKATKGIKNSKQVIKGSKKIATQTVKNTNRAINLAKETVRKTVVGIKSVVKVTISSVKAIIAGTKALISALIAGGWIAVIIIIVICLIGLLCSSMFGIFLSSENTGNSMTMNDVIKEINKEMADKIQNIKDTNIYDDYVLETDRAEWKEVLAIYTAKITNGNNETEVITMDDTKKNEIKKIFWEMHSITFEIKQEMSDAPLEKEANTILYITIGSKSVDEMMNMYHFTPIQKTQVDDLLDEKFSTMWSSVIYGTSVGNVDIVQIALTQVGNVGGQPYWTWYGFNSRVEWCAIFVSWVSNEAGYIEKGIIPKFSSCLNGVNWFKTMGQWKNKDYVPKSGDIIFFDWEVDGNVNHVGIVEKVENNVIYTIEGNSTNDTCRRKQYQSNSNIIFGFGIPAY